MILLDISIQARVIIGISAMVVLFTSFLIAFISNQRKKLQYHKDLQNMHERQQEILKEQNLKLEERVRERTNELSLQKDSLQNALSELKASQLQLIQKEKMASLGEIATGIAHEIQNPLNFVNNFAELNGELLTEMKELIVALDEPEKMKEIESVLHSTIQNIQKINQHGKRADNIVKSLLQHTRTGSQESVLYNINSLVEEDLTISYHNFRSRHKGFKTEINLSLDPAINEIKIVPQDVGRVLLNIFDNAFYSMMQKQMKTSGPYKPEIVVVTRIGSDRIKVSVRDNGLGISSKFINKIYQPFFTTKPTGEGTGLGLSLSYEIIKAQGGELKVESVENEYAEFTVELPFE
jgi:C4-dicarboxylate-specific signal transduction histidine kinase